MFKNISKLITSFLIISFCYSAFAQNVSKTGTTAANFLEISVGAPAMGMGGAFVSIANDASSLYWNPAGIAKANNYEALVTHTAWIAETNFDFAGLVLPLG